MHRTRAIPFALLLALAAPAAAGAAPVVDRVQVGGIRDEPATKRFSHALAVDVVAPPSYKRGGGGYDGKSGKWQGPEYRASVSPQFFSGLTSITWGVRFVKGTNLKSLARKENGDYPQGAAGKVKLRHVVVKRTVGKLKAYWVMDAEKSPGARADGALAIGLSKRAVAIVTFYALDPATEDAGQPGKVTVNGTPAGAWNRKQVQKALKKVYIEGNLPPSKVKAKASGRSVKGELLDAFGDPVANAPVALKKGSSTVSTGLTNSRGRFALKASKAGRYRVSGKLEGYAAKSKTVKVK
jgi:Carboxypeptidase regulatory-like domain